MQPIRVLIVDDEPLAQELLESYIHKIPGVQLEGKCSNALEAFAVLNRKEVDVILLDINMPEINGIDFIRALKSPPLVIFTTAYSEFAVESYDLNAIDYLLKPVTFDRFMKAVNKITEIMAAPKTMANIATASQDNILFVKSDGKMIKIDLAQLWFVEGLKNYIRLWTETGKIIVHSTMKNIEEQLATMPMFLRISKSYIINLRHVSEIDGNCIRIRTEALTIGNTYRDEVLKVFDSYKLM